MAIIHDYIVVGSGMTGAHAAQTLVDAGCKVLMLDVGFRDSNYSQIIPDNDFISIRENDKSQHRYFLGDDFEGIPWGDVHHALTPPRQYIAKDVEKWLPFESKTFFPIESLSYGGRGSGWGAGCSVYPDWELKEIGLARPEIMDAYEVIAGRIGVSVDEDDIAPYCSSGLKNVMPGMRMDNSISSLYQTYLKKRHKINGLGYYAGRTPLAVLTEDWPDRKKIKYKDMEFWADHDGSVYRSWMTVDQLKTRDNFIYKDNCLVLSFMEIDDHVKVYVRRVDTNEEEVFCCRKLILAAGALGTARVVLRSFQDRAKLPVLTNPYCIVPCINWRMIGSPLEQFKTSLGQMDMFYDENNRNMDVRFVSFYTYRSLLLFKLVKEAPINMSDALKLMRDFQSSLIIATIGHPDRPSPDKYIEYVENSENATGDHLKVVYKLSTEEQKDNAHNEKQLMKGFRKLGCYPLKKQEVNHGENIHYAGTLPFNDQGKPYTLTSEGRLNGTGNVYVADSSGFKYLPASGLTFTSMAYAHIVARGLIEGR